MKKVMMLVAILFCATTTAKNKEVNRQPINMAAMLEEQREEAYLKLMTKMSLAESSGDWTKVNRIGAMGRYQFLRTTLQGLGIDIDTGEFRSNPNVFPPSVQDSAMIAYLKYNERILQEIMDEHLGDTLECGAVVTRTGILAAAHLGGAGSVRRFFREGYVAQDENGTTIVDYIVKFQTANL